MDFIGAKVLGLLLTPPGILLLLAFLGFFIQFRRRVIGNIVVGLSLVALSALSLPVTGRALIAPLETGAHSLPPASLTPDEAKKQADAIVVLGGGRYPQAPEYGDADAVSESTLHRLRYAAYLHRRTGLPMLVTGGAPFGEPAPEALLMQEALENDFQIRPRWTEARSRNTQENAAFSKEILAAAGIRRIYLVTHAWHMRRARLAFEHAGFKVIPAPTGYATRFKLSVLDFLPDARALDNSGLFFHEVAGIGWYYLRIATGR